MKPLPVDITFFQDDADTFRSTESVMVDLETLEGLPLISVVSRALCNRYKKGVFFPSKAYAFFGLLEKEGISDRAYTRPRDVPPCDPPSFNMQAAFVDDKDRMVIDVSVLRELQKKYDVKVTYSPMRNNPKVDMADKVSTEQCLPN